MTNPKPNPAPSYPAQGVSLVDRVNLFFHFRRYIKMITRRWFILALPCVLGVGYATYRAITSPDIFQAYSRIIIKPRYSDPTQNRAVWEEQLTHFFENQEQIMNTAALDRARRNLADSGKPFPFYSAVASSTKGTFQMTVESTQLDFARDLARSWAEEFRNYKRQSKEKDLGQRLQGTTEEIIDYTKRLTRAREAILQFNRTNDIANVKETGQSLQENLERYQKELLDLQYLRERLENKSKEEIASGGLLESSAKPDQTPPPPGQKRDQPNRPGADGADPLAKFESNSAYARLKLELREKEAELAETAKILKPAHPHFQKLQAELADIAQKIQFELALIEERRVARIESLRKDEASLRPIVEDLKKDVWEKHFIRTEYDRLIEEEQSIKNTLDKLRSTKQSYELTSNEQEDDFEIIESGVGINYPVRPNRFRLILNGLLFSVTIGIGIIYFLDRLDDRLDLAEDIQAELATPVLGQIPQVSIEPGAEKRLLMTRMDEHSMFSESIRGVRSAVTLGMSGGKKKVLLATSAVPEDGKTTFTVNFAVTLAIAGHKVLLVDADLRRGNVHNYFGAPREPGLSEVLAGQIHWSDVLFPSDVPTLKGLSCGKPPFNPGELLFGPVVHEFIAEAREEFDYVVIDCPPLTAIDDTFSLLSSSDGLLFVVRSGQTSMRFAKNALNTLRQRSAPILGLVINGITSDNPYYYYQRYYHAYYSKGLAEVAPINTSALPARRMAARRTVASVPTSAPDGRRNGDGDSSSAA